MDDTNGWSRQFEKGGADVATGAAFDAVAFLDRQAEVFREQRRVELARLGLRPGQVVLDAGCGPGTDTFELEGLVASGGRVVGVDASEMMIEVARQRAVACDSAAEFVVGDVRALDLPDATFDLVRCVFVLLHVENPGDAVRELTRVLRPGGRLVCIDFDHQMDAVDATDVALAERVFRGRFAELRNPRIGRQLRGLFVAAGLVKVDVEVTTEVITSWADLNALEVRGRPTVVEQAALRGIATRDELAALQADLEARDAAGRFFACGVRMRCSGLKP